MLDKQQLNQLYRYCYSLTAHRDDAYDLLQSAMEKYLKQKNRTLKSEVAYLRRIVRNQFIDNARRRHKVVFEPLMNTETLALESCSLDRMMIREELIDAIWCLLNESEREILFLWAVEGYTSTEIAHEIQAPRGTVLSRIHRLRQKITTAFKEDVIDMKATSKRAYP